MDTVTEDRAGSPARHRAKPRPRHRSGPRPLAQPKYLTHVEDPGARSPSLRPPACAGTLISEKRQSHTLLTGPCPMKRLAFPGFDEETSYSP
jgi:hypothetical protein